MGKKLSMDELDRIKPGEFAKIGKSGPIVILENVRSAMNVGSVFRSCDAFEAKELVLCGYTPSPPHKEIQKTALGATETVAWRHAQHIGPVISSLRQEGYSIYAVEQATDSQPLHQFMPQRRIAYIFGNEVHGVLQQTIDLSDGVIEVPQFGTKHSLNIAVCAGIVLWHHTFFRLR